MNNLVVLLEDATGVKVFFLIAGSWFDFFSFVEVYWEMMEVKYLVLRFISLLWFFITHRIPLWYDDLPTFTIEKSTIHAAKCTSPMDPMGYFISRHSFLVDVFFICFPRSNVSRSIHFPTPILLGWLWFCLQVVVSHMFFFQPETWGNDPNWRAHCSNGLVQPPPIFQGQDARNIFFRTLPVVNRVRKTTYSPENDRNRHQKSMVQSSDVFPIEIFPF